MQILYFEYLRFKTLKAIRDYFIILNFVIDLKI